MRAVLLGNFVLCCYYAGASAQFCPNVTAQNAVINLPMPVAAGRGINVTCNPGYAFSDGSSNKTISCLANGTWASNQRNCSASMCGLPPLVQYATRSTDSVAYGTTLTYQCISGHWYPDIGGVTKNIQCVGTGSPLRWAPIAPAVTYPQDCSALVCAKFRPPLNAWADSYDSKAGTVLNVWCEVGYLYSNGRRAVQYACTGSSTSVQWQLQTSLPATPQCIAVTCPIPSIQNATVLQANGSLLNGTLPEVGDQVVFFCNRSGYSFPGGQARFNSTCTASGILVPYPPLSGCQATLPACGDPPWSYYNGSCYFVSNVTDAKQFADAEAACVAQGAHLLFLTNKLETSYAATVAGMRVNGYSDRWIGLQSLNGTSWKWTSGYTPTNYTAWLTGFPEMWKCAVMSYNGGWKDKACTFTFPYLCRKDQVCRNPPTIANANITVSPVPSYVGLGDTLTYRCLDGYWATSTHSKEQIVTCLSRSTWSFLESCQSITCSPKVRVENAVGNTTNILYGTYIGYTCKPGFRYPDGSTTKVAKCGADGQWRGINVDCQAIQCAQAATPNATSINGLFNVGAVDTYTCEAGFEYSDGTTVKQYNCLSTGIWSPRTLCQKIQCPQIQKVNSSVTNATGNFYLDTATITCNVGHKFFIGNNTYQQRIITCLSNKSWSEALPSCIALPCPTPLPNVTNAVAQLSGVQVGAVVNYTCIPPTRYVDGQTWMAMYCDPATAQWTKAPTECLDPSLILLPSFPDRAGQNSHIVFIGQSIIVGLVVLAAMALLMELCDSHMTASRLLEKSEGQASSSTL